MNSSSVHVGFLTPRGGGGGDDGGGSGGCSHANHS